MVPGCPCGPGRRKSEAGRGMLQRSLVQSTCRKTNMSPEKLMVGRCISYWNSPFLGDMLVFGGNLNFSTYPKVSHFYTFKMNPLEIWKCSIHAKQQRYAQGDFQKWCDPKVSSSDALVRETRGHSGHETQGSTWSKLIVHPIRFNKGYHSFKIRNSQNASWGFQNEMWHFWTYHPWWTLSHLCLSPTSVYFPNARLSLLLHLLFIPPSISVNMF